MTRLWKKGAAALGALAAAGALVVTAPAANAATTAKPQQATTMSAMSAQAKAAARRSCPNHKLCIYQYRNGRGKMSIIRHSHSKLGFWNNRISSAINRTSYPICVYNYAHYRGRFPGHPHTQYYLGAHASGNLSKAIDNRIGSYRYAPHKSVGRC